MLLMMLKPRRVPSAGTVAEERQGRALPWVLPNDALNTRRRTGFRTPAPALDRTISVINGHIRGAPFCLNAIQLLACQCIAQSNKAQLVRLKPICSPLCTSALARRTPQDASAGSPTSSPRPRGAPGRC